MKKILFCAFLMTSFFALETVAQVRSARGKGTRTVSYQLDGKSILSEGIDAKTTGIVSFLYGRLSGQVSLINGSLDGPFRYNNITGLINKNGSFSLKDANENWAEGHIVCPGVETFKLFTYALQTHKMEDFYKCIDVQKASYEFMGGEFSFLGSIKYPLFGENTTISYTLNPEFVLQKNKQIFLPKKLDFQFDEAGKNLTLNFVTQKEENFSFDFSFREGILKSLNNIKSDKEYIKKEILNTSLTQILIPQLNSKDGLVFKGEFNLGTGLKLDSTLNLFNQAGQRLIELKKLDEGIKLWAKYPNTLNTFFEGQIFAPHALRISTNSLILFLLSGSKNVTMRNSDLALLLSGLQLKDFSLYDENNGEIASFNIQLSEQITEKDILAIKEAPYLLDQYIKGVITLIVPQKGEMKIEFNNMDTVTVNGKEGFGENQADFYGVVTMLAKLCEKQIEAYNGQMEAVLKNIVYLGDIYQAYLEKKERDAILNTAKQFALTNYDYCIKELEAERIGYMYECQGVSFDKIAGLKPINGIDMTLTAATKMGAEHSFMYYDEKVGRDAVMVQLKFENEDLCQSFATAQEQVCENKTVTMGIQTELKTY